MGRRQRETNEKPTVTVGQEIILKSQSKRNTVLIRRSACAAAAVIIMSTTAWAYGTPYSYVSLDINPSIEYSVNRFDRVLSCSAVNGDGADIVEELRVNHKKIQDAVSETIRKIATEGYFEGEGTENIIIAASSKSDRKSEYLVGQLKETAEKEVDENGLDVELESVGVGQEYVQEAQELGITPGKLVLVDRLRNSGKQLNEEEVSTWLESPVKDIMKQIKENKREEKEAFENGSGKSKNGGNQITASGDSGEDSHNPTEDPKDNHRGPKSPNDNQKGQKDNPKANSAGVETDKKGNRDKSK
jgi:hypothetical protein